MTRLPGRLLRRGCLLEERIYRRIFKLRPVGDLIYLGRGRYQGPKKVLADDTCINPGDPLGILHVDNLRLASIKPRPEAEAHRAFVFIRLLRDSLVLLAQHAQNDPELKNLASFRGITWMPSRGRHLGFETEPLPHGLRSRLLNLHFRLMLRAFYPEMTAKRVLQPHVYWLTRRQLLDRFADAPATGYGER